MTLHEDDPRHGTRNGYSNLGCRCDACRDAVRVHTAQSRRRRQQQGLPASDPRHGKSTTYTNWGCRCERCRSAHQTDYNQWYGSRA